MALRLLPARRRLALAAALLAAAPVAADAQREEMRVDTTVAIASGGSVHLTIASGEIRVVGESRSDVRIRATVERGRIESTYSSDRISLRTRGTRNGVGNARFEIAVPVGTRVTASAVSGVIDVRATQGEVVASTVSGDIRIMDATDRVEAQAVSGSVSLDRVGGRIRVESVSGSVVVDQARGDLSVETVSGGIQVRDARLDGMRATTVSAGLSFDGTLAPNGTYRLDSHSGRVTITLPADVGAALELETFSGRITSEFPLTLQPGEGTGRRGRRMEFTIGTGSARLIAGSFSGNVTIRRGSAAGNRE